jgi:putative ABC transport system ATP-binding protein
MSNHGPSSRIPLIELKQVHKNYRLGERSINAVKGVDLTIQKGEFIAVWGPSGSGKSTLCNLIGLIDDPSAGKVLLEGRDVKEIPDDRRSDLRNRTIGFIFQNFNLIPVLSALENVMLPLQIRGEVSGNVQEAAVRHLTELGLSEHVAHRPHKLSGGQQQRVAIARALIADPAVVIADEPTGNLDSETAVNIIELMRQLNLRRGTTFIFATHDHRLLEQADRTILLRDGSIVEDTSKE